MNTRHAREEYIDENNRRKIRPRRICGTRTGNFACCKSVRKSDLADYGVGVVFYFQFLKYMACLYFVMAVLSIPAMFIFYNGNTERSSDLDIGSLVTQFSLGNLGASDTACGSGVYDKKNVVDGNKIASIPLSCPYGKLAAIQNFA